MRRTAQKNVVATVKKSHLVEAFTGYPHSKWISPQELSSHSSAELSTSSCRIGHRGGIAMRRCLGQLNSHIQTRALVVLYGRGGSGKSFGLLNWLSEVCASPFPRVGTLASFKPAEKVGPSWINEALCQAANFKCPGHPRLSESSDEAIERIRLAGGQDLHRPIVILGLDALDEGTEDSTRRNKIVQLLDWFREEDVKARNEFRPPRASLILTCRDHKMLISWLKLGNAYELREFPFPSIRLDEFSGEELLELAMAESGPIRDRFVSTQLKRAQNQRSLKSGLLTDTSNSLVRPVNSEIFDLLHDPVLWGSFSKLDENVKTGVLDNEPMAVRRMAKEFTLWFCNKAGWRRTSLDQDSMLKALRSIAVASPNPRVPHDRKESWIAPASVHLYSDSESAQFYREAISAGYITSDDETNWRWRYRMCLEYLIAPEAI